MLISSREEWMNSELQQRDRIYKKIRLEEYSNWNEKYTRGGQQQARGWKRMDQRSTR